MSPAYRLNTIVLGDREALADVSLSAQSRWNREQSPALHLALFHRDCSESC